MIPAARDSSDKIDSYGINSPDSVRSMKCRMPTSENVQLVKRKHGISVPLELEIGGIVGVVDVIDCVESHKSKWFNGPFGWVLANPRCLRFRQCKGALGLFQPEY